MTSRGGGDHEEDGNGSSMERKELFPVAVRQGGIDERDWIDEGIVFPIITASLLFSGEN